MKAYVLHGINDLQLEEKTTPEIGPGQAVVIYGLGTIGLLMAMFLKEAGIERVMAAGNKDQQRKFAAMVGLEVEDFCDTRTQEFGTWLKERTNGAGADVFFECIGKSDTIAEAILYCLCSKSIIKSFLNMGKIWSLHI